MLSNRSLKVKGVSQRTAGSLESSIYQELPQHQGYPSCLWSLFYLIMFLLSNLCLLTDQDQLVCLDRGTPQIEVTFEVDANGILNVKAEDKASGKSEKITITNDKGRLSQEEIDRMVREAEEFAEEDKKIKEKIDARNSLESYVYNMKTQINDKDKLADKLESEEKEKIETAVKEALEWLDDNQNAETEDYQEKLKEVEAVCNPIITAVYQRSGGAPGGSSDAGEDEDSHDEL